jgi:hypothetical protein
VSGDIASDAQAIATVPAFETCSLPHHGNQVKIPAKVRKADGTNARGIHKLCEHFGRFNCIKVLTHTLELFPRNLAVVICVNFLEYSPLTRMRILRAGERIVAAKSNSSGDSQITSR